MINPEDLLNAVAVFVSNGHPWRFFFIPVLHRTCTRRRGFEVGATTSSSVLCPAQALLERRRLLSMARFPTNFPPPITPPNLRDDKGPSLCLADPLSCHFRFLIFPSQQLGLVYGLRTDYNHSYSGSACRFCILLQSSLVRRLYIRLNSGVLRSLRLFIPHPFRRQCIFRRVV